MLHRIASIKTPLTYNKTSGRQLAIVWRSLIYNRINNILLNFYIFCSLRTTTTTTILMIVKMELKLCPGKNVNSISPVSLGHELQKRFEVIQPHPRLMAHLRIAHPPMPLPLNLQVSISSTLYVLIFRTIVVFSSYVLVLSKKIVRKIRAFNIDEIDGSENHLPQIWLCL